MQARSDRIVDSNPTNRNENVTTRLNALRALANELGGLRRPEEAGEREPDAAISAFQDFKREFIGLCLVSFLILLLSFVYFIIFITSDLDNENNTTLEDCENQGILNTIFVALNGIFLLIKLSYFCFIYIKKVDLTPFSFHSKQKARLQVVHNLVIFIGVFLVIAFTTEEECEDLTSILVFVIVVLYLIYLCFPCLIILALLPFICLCLPCLLQTMKRLSQEKTNNYLNDIPIVMYGKRNCLTFSDDAVDTPESKNKLVLDLTPAAAELKQCSICLVEFTVGEKLRLLPCKGMHYFHVECIDSWLTLNDSCPCCRDLVLSPEIYSFFQSLAVKANEARLSQQNTEIKLA